MILVDTALKDREEQGKPIRVAMTGAGFMGQGLTNQIVNSFPGMRMVAVQNRHLEKAFHVYRYAGVEDIVEATTQAQMEHAIRAGQRVVTQGCLSPGEVRTGRRTGRCNRLGRIRGECRS